MAEKVRFVSRIRRTKTSRVKRLIPAPIRLQLQLLRRYLRYRLMRQYTYAQYKTALNKQTDLIEITLAIKPSSLYANKLHNLRLASDRLNGVTISVGEVFSFWQWIGPPTQANGFRQGRNIINGVLQEDYGGGLCQVSGLLYYLALSAGLEVLERSNHSVDIYTEDTRYTPLGTDATVVYGYKGLQFRNTLAGQLQLAITVNEDSTLTGRLYSRTPLNKKVLHFRRADTPTHKVVLIHDQDGHLLNRSCYVI